MNRTLCPITVPSAVRLCRCHQPTPLLHAGPNSAQNFLCALHRFHATFSLQDIKFSSVSQRSTFTCRSDPCIEPYHIIRSFCSTVSCSHQPSASRFPFVSLLTRCMYSFRLFLYQHNCSHYTRLCAKSKRSEGGCGHGNFH